MKIRIKDVDINGYKGYDVEIFAEDVTVEDYLDALNTYIEQGSYWRSRAAVSSCEGCELCCAERIPLTNLDLIKFREIPGSSGNNFSELIKRFAQVTIEAPVVDITLKRNELGKCHNLDPETAKCQIYSYRPLVCQTFICTPQTERARALRSAIVNLGEDELVRLWLLEGLITGNLSADNGDPQSIKQTDYVENLFCGKLKYSEVLIKEVCPTQLWKDLTRETNNS